MGKYICDCCGHKTLTDPKKSYEICPVCSWQNDGYIDYEGYYDTGANSTILSVAQKNYKDIGACDKRCLNYVRKPKDDEPYVGELKEYRER
ncbi:CPCC family cysteine-rich protein [Tepidibacter sp. Z1-5]|uniref:CPCC family cysteine-rich protein n=1 Tax=Tepidibacter sp. Z1-5 TaxID=3134138 RepID=UPI0030C17CBA